MKAKDDAAYDWLFKVRPLLDALKESFSKIEPEERHSIDEQMIPLKGRSSLKQYMKNKPHKCHYKVFTRAGVNDVNGVNDKEIDLQFLPVLQDVVDDLSSDKPTSFAVLCEG